MNTSPRQVVLIVTGDGVPQCRVVAAESARDNLAEIIYGQSLAEMSAEDKSEEQEYWSAFRSADRWSVDQDGLPFEFDGCEIQGGSLRAFHVNS